MLQKCSHHYKSRAYLCPRGSPVASQNAQQRTPSCAPRPMALGTYHTMQWSLRHQQHLLRNPAAFTCCCEHTLCHANARRPNTAHPPHKPAGGCVHTQLTLLSGKPRRSKHSAHLHTHRMLSTAAATSQPTAMKHHSARTATPTMLMTCAVQCAGEAGLGGPCQVHELAGVMTSESLRYTRRGIQATSSRCQHTIHDMCGQTNCSSCPAQWLAPLKPRRRAEPCTRSLQDTDTHTPACLHTLHKPLPTPPPTP